MSLQVWIFPRQPELCQHFTSTCMPLMLLTISPPFTSLLPISSTDPITNCFLKGRELPCSTEEAGASLLLWCDQMLRYTPTDQGGEVVCVCTVCVSVIWLIKPDIHIQSSFVGRQNWYPFLSTELLDVNWPLMASGNKQWHNSKALL